MVPVSHSVRRWLRAGALALVGSALACQGALPAPPPEARITPIELPGESEPIVFQGVAIRVPAGMRIGAWYWRSTKEQLKEIRWDGTLTRTSEFNVAATDHLRQHGYRAVDPTEALFTDDDHVKTRFRLGGVVTRMSVDGHASRPAEKSHAIAEIEMEVNLFDGVRKETVYERSFSGWGIDQGQDPRPLVPAVLNALDKALTDPEFAARVTRAGDTQVATGEPLAVPACEAPPVSLPGDVEAVRRAVFTIRSGSSTGTGVLISPDGHALTAAHVVSGLDEVRALLASGLELPARVLRVDLQTDAALIQVSGTRHACVRVGSEPITGQDVYLIGSVFGEELALSVTKGIVSGHRVLEGVRLIQTDASANPGSSGGPLLDTTGRIGGILTQKVVGLGIEGTGFALPVELVSERLSLNWGTEKP